MKLVIRIVTSAVAKYRICSLLTTWVLLSGLGQAAAQGTAFIYQGQLNDNGIPANGTYDVSFGLFNATTGGSAVVAPLTNSEVAVSNGMFTVTLDFGPGIFNGSNYWLESSVRTNRASRFNALSPRQAVLPMPYSIFAANTGNATSATTAATAENFSGWLNGNVTGPQSATIVASVGGQSAAQVASAAAAANAATSAATPNTIVQRDGSASFFAAAITAGSLCGDGSALTNLNACHLCSGTIPAGLLPVNLQILNTNNALNLTNIPAGQLTGSVPGATLTSIPAGNLTGSVPTGTLPAGLQVLSANNAVNLTNIPAGQLTGKEPQAVINSLVITNADAKTVGVNTNWYVGGTNTAYAGVFTNGLGSTPLNASQLSSGTVPTGLLPVNLQVLTTNNAVNLTNIPAGQLTGSVPSATLTSIPAGNLTGSVPSATLTSIPAANLTGSVPSATLTSIPAGNLTGSVPSATLTSIPAANLTGSVPSATLTSIPAGNLTGSVPSAALTSIPAANLTGSVPTGTLPAGLQVLSANNAVNLTNIPAGQLTGMEPQAVINSLVITNADAQTVGVNTNWYVGGTNTAYAGVFTNGLGSTPLNASQLSSGTVPTGLLPVNLQVLTTNNAVNLTNIPAGQLTGSVPNATLTSIPAGNLTGSVPSATLTSIPAGNLTGSVPSAALTSIPAANLTGSVPSATLTSIPAANLTGSVPSATLTSIPAGNLTGSVPSAALTSIPAANLTGSVPTGTLPAGLQVLSANNAVNLTNIPAGQLTGMEPQAVINSLVITNADAQTVGVNTNWYVGGTNTAYAGVFTNGLGSTPLNASQLSSGTVPTGLLPVNLQVLTTNNAVNLTNIPAGQLTGSVPNATLTSIPAGNLTGSVPSATLTSIPAGNLTGSVPSATLTSIPAANLTGSVPSATLTSIPAGNLTGSVPSATLTSIPAGNLTGSVPSATLTSIPAANLTGSVPTGTLPAGLQVLSANNAVNLTNIPASQLTGTIPQSALPTNLLINSGSATISAAAFNATGSAANTFGGPVIFTNHFGMATNTAPTILVNYGSKTTNSFYPPKSSPGYDLAAGATDYNGILLITNGIRTGHAGHPLFTNTFCTPFNNPPAVVVSGGNLKAAATSFSSGVYVTSTRTNFVVSLFSTGAPPVANDVYIFHYIVSGQ